MLNFKDTHREKEPSNKIPEAFKMKQNFWKNKVGTGKTSFFVVGYFVLTILFVLTLPSAIAVLYGNDALSILLFSTEKRYFSFLKKVFVLKKICFKVNDTHGERLVFHSIQYTQFSTFSTGCFWSSWFAYTIN